MRKIPRRFAPFVYGVIQAGITTAVATGIATLQALGFNPWTLPAWAMAWLIAWATMLPVVILIAPFIQRAVMRFVEPPPS